MIKRSTWIVLFLLALLIGIYFFLKSHPTKSVTPTPTAIGNSFLLPDASGKLKSIQIVNSQNKTSLLERDSSGVWQVVLPALGPADQAKAEAAETQVGAMSIVNKLETSPELSAMGLATPADQITLIYLDGTQHTIEVGNLTPTSSGYYIRLDNRDIYVVSQDGIDPIVQMLDNPPYAPTPTPPAPAPSPSTSLLPATPTP